MSAKQVSRKIAHDLGHNERHADFFYNLMTQQNMSARPKLVKGIQKFIENKQSTHVAMQQMFAFDTVPTVIERAIILAAIVHEPDFLQHLMDRKDTCSSSLSQFVVNVLPNLVEQLFNGTIDLQDFVLRATHLYIIL